MAASVLFCKEMTFGHDLLFITPTPFRDNVKYPINEEGAMKRKERRRGRSDDEEGATTKIKKIEKKIRKMTKLLEGASLTSSFGHDLLIFTIMLSRYAIDVYYHLKYFPPCLNSQG